MKINDVLIQPLITEKSTELVGKNQYSFKVNPKMSKGAIEKAVEDTFGVDVLSVRTFIVAGKQKRMLRERKYSKLPKWKKAIVTLKAGQKINMFEIKEEK